MSRRVKPLPDWNSREPEPMLEWLRAMLDKENEEFVATFEDEPFDPRQFEKERQEEQQQRANVAKLDKWALDQAKHGNIEPLRRNYPHLADFLHLPKRKRGYRFHRKPLLDFVQVAANAVPHIHALWAKHYKKKKRERGQTSAEEFAALLWDVDVNDVRNVRKQRRR
jgi:hypothetical protein